MNLVPWEKGMKDKAIEGPRIKRWKQWKIKPMDEKELEKQKQWTVLTPKPPESHGHKLGSPGFSELTLSVVKS